MELVFAALIKKVLSFAVLSRYVHCPAHKSATFVLIYSKAVLHTGYRVSQGRPYLVGCSQLQRFVRPIHAGRQGDVRPIRREPTSVTRVDQLRSSRQERGRRDIMVYRWTENCACLLNMPPSCHIECSRRANSSDMVSRCQLTKSAHRPAAPSNVCVVFLSLWLMAG